MNATATVAPGPQHLRALQRANEVRLARADLKRRVSSGETRVSDVVLDGKVITVRGDDTRAIAAMLEASAPAARVPAGALAIA